jgi:hypothetical protein
MSNFGSLINGKVAEGAGALDVINPGFAEQAVEV